MAQLGVRLVPKRSELGARAGASQWLESYGGERGGEGRGGDSNQMRRPKFYGASPADAARPRPLSTALPQFASTELEKDPSSGHHPRTIRQGRVRPPNGAAPSIFVMPWPRRCARMAENGLNGGRAVGRASERPPPPPPPPPLEVHNQALDGPRWFPFHEPSRVGERFVVWWRSLSLPLSHQLIKHLARVSRGRARRRFV